MRIAIIGPGALGCLFASHLAARHQAWLVDRDPARARELDAAGIVIERHGQRTRHRIPVLPAGRDDRAELLLLAVKSPAVAQALADNQPLVSRCRILVGLQNGIGHLDTLAACAPSSLAAVTSMGAHCPRPGHVVHAGEGGTEIGVLAATPDGDRVAAEVAALFTAAGLPTTVAGDIRAAIWNKLLVNVGINALTGILDCANGELASDPWALETMRAAIEEATEVARALGVPVAGDGFARALAVCRATAGNISSLLQDLRRRRPTEITAINGAVAELAERHGIDAPANRMLTTRILAIEKELGIRRR